MVMIPGSLGRRWPTEPARSVGVAEAELPDLGRVLGLRAAPVLQRQATRLPSMHGSVGKFADNPSDFELPHVPSMRLSGSVPQPAFRLKGLGNHPDAFSLSEATKRTSKACCGCSAADGATSDTKSVGRVAGRLERLSVEKFNQLPPNVQQYVSKRKLRSGVLHIYQGEAQVHNISGGEQVVVHFGLVEVLAGVWTQGAGDVPSSPTDPVDVTFPSPAAADCASPPAGSCGCWQYAGKTWKQVFGWDKDDCDKIDPGDSSLFDGCAVPGEGKWMPCE
jgi:hypothetical protein